MENYKIFLQQKAIRLPIGNGFSYSFSPACESFAVFLEGNRIFHTSAAQLGDLYVIRGNNYPIIKKLNPPMRRSDLIMWILGFPSSLRCHGLEHYQELLQKHNPKYPLESFEDVFYKITICNRPKRTHLVAAWVNSSIDKHSIIQLCNTTLATDLPKDYVEKIFIEKLQFSKFELEQIKPSFYCY